MTEDGPRSTKLRLSVNRKSTGDKSGVAGPFGFPQGAEDHGLDSYPMVLMDDLPSELSESALPQLQSFMRQPDETDLSDPNVFRDLRKETLNHFLNNQLRRYFVYRQVLNLERWLSEHGTSFRSAAESDAAFMTAEERAAQEQTILGGVADERKTPLQSYRSLELNASADEGKSLGKRQRSLSQASTELATPQRRGSRASGTERNFSSSEDEQGDNSDADGALPGITGAMRSSVASASAGGHHAHAHKHSTTSGLWIGRSDGSSNVGKGEHPFWRYVEEFFAPITDADIASIAHGDDELTTLLGDIGAGNMTAAKSKKSSAKRKRAANDDVEVVSEVGLPLSKKESEGLPETTHFSDRLIAALVPSSMSDSSVAKDNRSKAKVKKELGEGDEEGGEEDAGVVQRFFSSVTNAMASRKKPQFRRRKQRRLAAGKQSWSNRADEDDDDDDDADQATAIGSEASGEPSLLLRLEEKIRKELVSLGILNAGSLSGAGSSSNRGVAWGRSETKTEGDDNDEDDDVPAHLLDADRRRYRQLKARLRAQQDYNRQLRRHLVKLARAEQARQAYEARMNAADRQLEAAYRRRLRSRKVGRPPSAKTLRLMREALLHREKVKAERPVVCELFD
eukprot:Clim_evm83s108 gene=Clim_evmTU83s108